MKKSNLLLSFVFIFILFTSSFTIHLYEDFDIKFSIKGVEHALKDGITPSEFGILTVESTSENLKIESVKITLARGDRAVSITDVKGNMHNLRKLAGEARSGDRIVIEVKKLNKEHDSLNQSNSIIAIRVN